MPPSSTLSSSSTVPTSVAEEGDPETQRTPPSPTSPGGPGKAEPAPVGIVLVSHSAQLAEGAAELARAMAGADVRIVAAGGLAPPLSGLGTDATRVAAAIEEAWSERGVLVLMDLGSALLAGEMALDFLSPGRRERVRLSAAPLVEGAVAAAVAARLGEPLEGVEGEAVSSLSAKAAQISEPVATPASPPPPAPEPAPDAEPPAAELRVTVDLPLGLHARPAARLVRATAGLTAKVLVAKASAGSVPVNGRSLNALATLQVRQGQALLVRAEGPDAEAAIAAIRALAARQFDEPEELQHLAPVGGPVSLPTAWGGMAATPAPPPAVSTAPSAGGAEQPVEELRGIPASPGIAAGPLRPLLAAPVAVPAGDAADPALELQALDRALSAIRSELEQLRETTRLRAGDDEAEIIDADLLFLDDPALLEPTREAVLGRRRTAAQAWSETSSQLRRSWESLDDPHLRLRAADLAGVSRRVLERLLGGRAVTLTGAGILVADDLAPTDTASLDLAQVRGIATAGGGPTSHSAIMARGLGIPAVVGLGDALLSLAAGRRALLDGGRGTLTLDPAPAALRHARSETRRQERNEARAAVAATRPARTRDGVTVEVAANIGSVEEATRAVEAGAEGVGLLRTEFLFLQAASLPDEVEQERVYSEIARRLDGRPLTVRTLDVGADKPLPYLPTAAEANPALGLRGIRLGLARPEILLPQLRAVVATARRYPVRVMFPMVAGVGDLRRARALLDEAMASAPVALEVGMMVEVPSAALTARSLAALVDFFSIGTNDLSQYTLAADRGNAAVAAVVDALHPAVLRLIGEAARATARGRRPWVGVCGELAGDVAAVPLLIGLGVRELSVAVPLVARVKQAVRAADTGECARLARAALRLADAAAVRALLTEAHPPSPLR
jgi:phosphoenolpyruvate-protein phosphotransferase/dihydroxyacetone kinase phosphotransfer subunit